jgi:ribosomal protein L31
MQVQINNMSRSKHNSFYFTATCGKKTAIVVIDEDKRVNVVVQNASHKAWGGMGKFFPTKQTAIDSYKSGEMKAIIQTAFEHAPV